MKIKLNFQTALFYLISAASLFFIIVGLHSAFKSLIMLLIFSFSLYLGGYYLQKENNVNSAKIMKVTFIIMFVVYIVYILALLFTDAYYNRNAIVEQRINLVPFKTIALFLDSANTHSLPVNSIITNLLGNFVAFMPFGFYLPLFFNKFKKYYWFLLVVILIVSAVEVLQLIFMCGSCDIDDLILNVFGAFVFYLITNNKIVTPYIKKIVIF